MILIQGLIRHLENGDVKMAEKTLKEKLQELENMKDSDLTKKQRELLERLRDKKDGIVKQKPRKKKMPMPMKKPEMMYGGMANNKKHMYAAGGSVQDNPGLKALAKKRPDVVRKMGYNV